MGLRKIKEITESSEVNTGSPNLLEYLGIVSNLNNKRYIQQKMVCVRLWPSFLYLSKIELISYSQCDVFISLFLQFIHKGVMAGRPACPTLGVACQLPAYSNHALLLHYLLRIRRWPSITSRIKGFLTKGIPERLAISKAWDIISYLPTTADCRAFHGNGRFSFLLLTPGKAQSANSFLAGKHMEIHFLSFWVKHNSKRFFYLSTFLIRQRLMFSQLKNGYSWLELLSTTLSGNGPLKGSLRF